jgi:putative DNA primase/helicase
MAWSVYRIVNVLGARRAGNSWIARCPAHDDKTPSLSISEGEDGKVLVYCHAGCDQEDVIAELIRLGLWHNNSHDLYVSRHDAGYRRSIQNDAKRSDYAQAIWLNAVAARGTLVETYLRARGITLPISDTIRFHGDLKHPSGDRLPAMVALVTDRPGGDFAGIHRTFLSRDGKSKASVEPQKMMLGNCGGGAVWFAQDRPTRVVGEGIETTLSAMQLWSLSGCAALSAGGMERLFLGGLSNRVLIAADNDKAGFDAASILDRRMWAARKQAKILRPEPPAKDFNDVLVSKATEEGQSDDC